MNKVRNEQVRKFPSTKTLWASQGNHGNNRNTGNLNVICMLGTTLIMEPTEHKYNISDRKTHKCK